MPRKKVKGHFRPLSPDAKHNSILVTKLVKRVMLDGKKSLATAIVYSAMDFLAEKTDVTALEALETAINNIKPPVEVRSRRVGGATYQVPVDVRAERQLCLEFVRLFFFFYVSQKKNTKTSLLIFYCNN